MSIVWRVFLLKRFISNIGNRLHRSGESGGEPSERVERFRTMFGSLQIHYFRILWFGMLFSMAAIQMNIISRAWLAYDLTGSGLAIGLVAIARGAPRFFAAPFGGVAADRIDKRMLLLVTQIIRFALALSLGFLVVTDRIELWHLMVIGVVQGLSSAFMMPTRTAFISDLVSDEKLSNAIALDSTGRNLNRVIAPALAGILIAINPAIVFFVIAGFYAIATLTMLRLPSSRTEKTGAPQSVMVEARAGFSYIRNHGTIMALMLMTIVVILLGMPFRSLLPVFQQDVLHVGPTALGFMYTMIGVGAIAASLFVAYVSESDRKTQMLIGSGLGFGIFLTLFALSGAFWLALIMLLLVGFASQTYLTLNKTMVMLATNKQYYGRVMSIYMMGFSIIPLVLLPMGAAVDSIGAPITVAFAGVLLLVAVIVGGISQGVIGLSQFKSPVSRSPSSQSPVESGD